MAFTNLKPVKFNPEQLKQMQEAVQTQNPLATKFQRSNDEANYPVFVAPDKGVVTVYIPNHQVQKSDGSMALREDVLYLHTVRDGSQYGSTYRCMQGITGISDYDGTCPLCEAARMSTDWFFRQVDAHGLRNDDSEAAKTARATLNKGKVVTTPTVRHLFPVVILQSKDDGSKGVNPVPMWMSMTDIQFEKLMKAMNAVADDETGDIPNPAGHLFTFDYGNYSSRSEAARYLTITLKHKGLSKETCTKLDKLTEPWDVAKGIEMVKEAEFYPREAFAGILSMTEQKMLLDSGTSSPVKQITDATDEVVESVDVETILAN